MSVRAFVFVSSLLAVCSGGNYEVFSGKCGDNFQNLADCLKGKAIDLLDKMIRDEKPIALADFIVLTHDEESFGKIMNETTVGETEEDLKDSTLTKALFRKMRQLIKAKSLRVDFDGDNQIEGRKKKKDKGMGMMMMMAAGGMMMHHMMSKIAFIAGKALIVAKIALLISGIIGLKKLLSGKEESGGESTQAQIIYAKPAESGGWHRSMDMPMSGQHAHMMAYGAHGSDS